MTAEFVGAGWAFPLRVDSTGRMALVARSREIEEAIRLVLGTSPGERPMRPEFGSRIREMVFSPADASTAGLLASETRAALERWEPRIEVDDVDVTFDAHQEGTLYIDIHYRVRGTNDPRNLVFPFYLIPEHPEGAGVAREVPETEHRRVVYGGPGSASADRGGALPRRGV